MSENCGTCGQRIVQGNISFGRLFAKMLWMANGFARDVEAKWKADRADANSETKTELVRLAFLSSDFAAEGTPITLYNNLSKLRHWDLASQREGWWHQGIYQLTLGAKSFMMGTATVPREITVQGRMVIARSEEQISYEQAWGRSWPDIAEHISTWRRGQEDIGTQGELF
jgi:hypothetical protein